MFWLKDATLLSSGKTGLLGKKCAQNSIHRFEQGPLNFFCRGAQPDFLNSTALVFRATHFQNVA